MLNSIPAVFRLTSFQKSLIFGSVSLMTLSGLAWIAVQWRFSSESDLIAALPALKWLIKIHVVAALVSLVALGTLLVLHVPKGWRQTYNKRSGVVNLSSWLALSVSGYLLWYGPQDALRDWVAWSHWLLGVLFPLSICFHLWSRRSRVTKSHQI
jgi:hypothetical protein